LKKAYQKAGETFHIEVNYPFSGRQRPKSNREYWRRFEDLLACEDVLRGILGMEHPHKHWVAFESRQRRLALFDSTATAKRWRIAKEDIHAGRRPLRTYLANRRDLVIFRCTC